jgi:hypothetical protein
LGDIVGRQSPPDLGDSGGEVAKNLLMSVPLHPDRVRLFPDQVQL